VWKLISLLKINSFFTICAYILDDGIYTSKAGRTVNLHNFAIVMISLSKNDRLNQLKSGSR